MAVALQDRKRSTSALKSWTDDVAAYERWAKEWETRNEKILKRYRDKRGQNQSAARFNILWSNVQTLVPATYSKVPKPDVSRRFRDSDPIGRIASLIVERGLEFEITHYPFYRDALKQCVLDRFLGGRGTSWVRYEPHMKPMEDVQITEDVDPPEEIDYECAPVDYVSWRDFGHSIARTWAEVTRVWRKVYMGREALIARFGKEVGKAIPLDELPEDMKRQEQFKGVKELACIYEGWDREARKAVWFCKAVKDVLDERDINADPESPPLFDRFFPCPPPLFATITNESLEPIPDFTLYQDQANELDTLADRIDGLVKALKVTGVYDASQGPELARLFTEGVNGVLIPIKNWMAFAEKNGLKGAIDVVDLDPIARALKESYTAFAQIIDFIYQITGIADIVRGVSDPNETLGAQEIKRNFVGLRLGDMKQDVARFATENLQLVAEIMCTKYQPATLLAISQADQIAITDSDVAAAGVPMEQAAMLPMEQKRQIVLDAALALLKNKPLRTFRIEVNADTLVQLDEQLEKDNALEFAQATAGFVEKIAVGLSQVAPPVAAIVGPLMMDLLKFAAVRFRAGKSVEGAIDDAADKLKALAQQPPPPPAPDPALQVAEVKAKAEERKAELGVQTAEHKAQLDDRRMQREEQHDQAELMIDGQRLQMEVAAAHAMPQKPNGAGRPQ